MISAVAATDTPARFQVAQRWPLTGPGGSGFLLVSKKDHRLYLSRDTQVTVLDTNDGKAIGQMRGFTDVRGIALDPDGKFGYIGDGINGDLKVFSVPTLTVTSSIKIGGNPEAVVFEPATHRVIVFDSHNELAVVLDPSSQHVIGSVKLNGRPGAAMVDGNGSVFVNLVSTSQLARIDAQTLTIQKLQSLEPCVGPSGMAMDSAHSRIFSVCENKLMAVSDSRSGELVATAPIGEGAKTVGFDPVDGLVFSANGEGTLSVIKEAGTTMFLPVQTVKTAPGARTMAFDEEHRQLYVISARFGQRTGPTSEELEFRPTPVPGSSVVLVLKP
jgi:DNA-binding beta-propeller fold protein YncE